MSIHEDRQPQKRDLLISDFICDSSVQSIIKDVFDINRDDEQKSTYFKDWERPPIRLFINSMGGSVYDGLALIDAIRNSKTPIHTYCIGSCMSMGLWVWLAGKTRYVGEYATLMFHDISLFTYDKTEGIKQELNEMTRLQTLLISDITRNSLVTEDMLRDYIVKKAEWYITPKDAIDLKLADAYYKG